MNQPTSKCCNAPVSLYSGDEGTNHYVCTKCKEACDLSGGPVPAITQPNNALDTKNQMALHHVLTQICYEVGALGNLPADSLAKWTPEINKIIAAEVGRALENVVRSVATARSNDLTMDSQTFIDKTIVFRIVANYIKHYEEAHD